MSCWESSEYLNLVPLMRLKSQPQTVSQKKNLGSVSGNSSSVTALAVPDPTGRLRNPYQKKVLKNLCTQALWFGGTREFPRERALRELERQEAAAVRTAHAFPRTAPGPYR